MKRVLLDSNIFIRNERNLNSSIIQKFNEIVKKGDVKLIISLGHIAELAVVEELLERRKLLIKWIESLEPVWIYERFVLQREEVKKFIFEKFYKYVVEFNPFTRYLSECLHMSGKVLSKLNNIPEPKIEVGINASKLLKHYHLGKKIHSKIKENNFKMTERIKKLKPTISELGKLEKKRIQNRIFTEWIGKLIPVYNPENRRINECEKNEMIKYCLEKKNSLFLACPSLRLEEYYLSFKYNDIECPLKESDFHDLGFFVIAIGYCDFFISEDEPLRHLVTCCTKVDNGKLQILRGLEDLFSCF